MQTAQPTTINGTGDPREHQASTPPEATGSFQNRMQPWLLACFGAEIASDKHERSCRFLEEGVELVQAAGLTASEAHQLVDYVYNRPAGKLRQEVGGVMATLAALCIAHGVDMDEEAEKELARIWTMVDTIRAKQAAKPKFSPLPAAPLAGVLDVEILATAPAVIGGLISRPAQVNIDVFPEGTAVQKVIEAAQAFYASERTPKAAAERGSIIARLGMNLRAIEELPDDEPGH